MAYLPTILGSVSAVSSLVATLAVLMPPQHVASVHRAPAALVVWVALALVATARVQVAQHEHEKRRWRRKLASKERFWTCSLKELWKAAPSWTWFLVLSHLQPNAKVELEPQACEVVLEDQAGWSCVELFAGNLVSQLDHLAQQPAHFALTMASISLVPVLALTLADTEPQYTLSPFQVF